MRSTSDDQLMIGLATSSRRDLLAAYEALAEARGAAAERDAAIEHARDLERQLAAVRASTSWRITAPLRAITARVRGGS